MNDHEKFLNEYGLSEEVSRLVSENSDDIISIDVDGVYVGASDIEGKGVFADGEFNTGDVIAPARIDGNRTFAGRYTNHSSEPNAKMEFLESGNIYLVAIEDISNEEITTDYRETMKGQGIIPNKRYSTEISTEDFRTGIIEAQNKLLEMTELHIEPEVTHYFANGMYAREMKLNKGQSVIGKIHRFAHINTLSKGIVNVLSENGIARYEAPFTFVSEKWTKRAITAVEDAVWTTFHATTETDLDKIEKEHIAEDYEDEL